MTTTTDDFVLSAYDVKDCPVKALKKRGLGLQEPPVEEDLAATHRKKAGQEFEAEIFDQFLELHNDEIVDARGSGISASEREEKTVAAMKSGAFLIIGGALPRDEVGHRTGSPDILIRISESDQPRYLPIDVKHHRVHGDPVKGAAKAHFSYFSNPHPDTKVRAGDDPKVGNAVRFNLKWDKDDELQLAHYWRMLEACGFAPDCEPQGGIIGSDEVGDHHVITWFGLNDEQQWSTSRYFDGKEKKNPVMALYDFEHDLRVNSISNALSGNTDGLPLVQPVPIEDCKTCGWHDDCQEQTNDSGRSFEIHKIDPCETLTLWDHGFVSEEKLASLNPDGLTNKDKRAKISDPEMLEMVQAFEELQPKRLRYFDRLERSIRRSQLLLEGSMFQKLGEFKEPPRADVEIDFDIEWDRSEHTYLSGLLVTDRTKHSSDEPSQDYISITFWDEMNQDDHVRIAIDTWKLITEIIANSEASGKTCLVYHYTHPERTLFKRISYELEDASLTGTGDSLQYLDEYFSSYFVDLYNNVKSQFFGRDGLGLKQVAVHGAGFSWRDETPGGEQSQVWLDNVYAGIDREAHIERLLQYNEDDVRATWEVREWLSRLARGEESL